MRREPGRRRRRRPAASAATATAEGSEGLSRTGFDRFSLVAGVTVTVLGALMLLDQGGELDLSPGALTAIFVGAFGLIMLVSGLLEDR